MKYCLLNYIPSLVELLVLSVPIKVNIVVAIIYSLIIVPVYLLLVNTLYIIKHELSCGKSIIFMLSTVVINIAMFVITHKAQTGYFIGDIPEGIFYLWGGIPSVIIFVGILITYYIRVKK